MLRILVTGASSGIGAATAAQLREENVDVVELDVRPRSGGLACDLGDADDVRRVAAQIGRLDGIAHVAGVPGTHAPERVLAINVLGPRLLTDLLLPNLRAGGAIVFVSSLTAHRCTWPDAELRALLDEPVWASAIARLVSHSSSGSQAYDLSKRLLGVGLPDLVRRVARFDIRANLVSPGPVETPILDDFRATMGEDRIAAAARLVRRHAQPNEVAQAIVFLLQPGASWINGIDLIVDGGLSALRRGADRSAVF